MQKAALDRRLTFADIRVLAALSYFMNDKSKRAWPSYSRLAAVAGVSEISVRRAITRLKANSYIFTDRHAPISGGRAITHYGLKAIHPADIEAMISDAVKSLAASRTMQSAINLTAPPMMQPPSGCIQSGRSDCIKSRPQKPYIEEPIDSKFVDAHARDANYNVFDENELKELHALYNGWGRKPGSPAFNIVDRQYCDRMISDEIAACRNRNPGIDDGCIRSAALVTLNTLRSTRPTGASGGSMLKLFRAVIDSELARQCLPATQVKRAQARGPTSTVELARTAFGSRGA